MAFSKKTWVDREVEFPTRRKLTILDSSNSEEVVLVQRYEGEITKAGDAFNAQTMNNLETRIQTETHATENMLGTIMDGNTATDDTLKKGRYFVHQGNFYEVTKDIPNGGAITPGSNCTRTRISTCLSSLTSSFASLKSSLTTQINNLTKNFNTTMTTVLSNVGYQGEAIQDLKNITMAQTHFSLTNVQITNGGANFGPFNVGTVIRTGNVVGIIVTAVGGAQAEVYGGTILDNRPANCVFHVANLSNSTFTGRVNLEIILIGRAF